MEFKTLQELCTEIIDCPHTTPEWKTEGVPVIRNYNLQNGFIDKSKLSFVDDDTYLQRIKRGMPQVDDIIFSREAPVGSVAIMPSNFRCCLGQRLVLLKVNKSICDPHYLLYVMLSDFVKKQYKTVEKTGSIVSNFNIGDLKNLVIPYVDIAIQKKIGKMCGMLDRKIAVNNLTIENLESMAKTLYDYWFVQFDFPDANGRPYKTSGGKMEWNETLSREIPAGWEVGQVRDLGEVVAGGTPSTEHPEYFTSDGIAWITPKDMSLLDGKYIFHGGADISEEGLKNSSAKLMPAGSVVYTTRAPIGYVAIAGNDVCTNQGFKSVVPKKDFGTEFVYYTLKSLEVHFKNIGNGSTFSEVSKETFSTVPICIPPRERIRDFMATVDRLSGMQKKAQLENRKLIALRDFLLPMLMNGQVTFI